MSHRVGFFCRGLFDVGHGTASLVLGDPMSFRPSMARAQETPWY